MLGSYKLNENDATDYFRLYETIKGEESLTESEQEVWLFAIYYDFLNYVSQQLGSCQEYGQSLKSARIFLKSVMLLWYDRFVDKNEVMRDTMYAVIEESYTEPRYIKDINSDYQVLKSVTWHDHKAGESPPNFQELKGLLVNSMTPDEFDSHASHLRRGPNAIRRFHKQFEA